MPETIPPSTLPADLSGEAPRPKDCAAWDADLQVAVCGVCRCRFLLASGTPPSACPNCWGGRLALVPGDPSDVTRAVQPELVLPYAVADSALYQSVQSFCAVVPFAPADLKPSALASRLTRVYFPMWLVDADVYAFWQAEAGFDYQVISHQEVYDDSSKGWLSKEIKEPRVRWEDRVGRLKRAYKNIPVPAVLNAPRLEKQLGPFQQEDARQYHPEELTTGIVRLPDISRQDSWKEAVSALQKAAAGECRAACGSHRMREFRWKAQFSRQNWTLMLMPVYSTSYQDDDGTVHPVLIHGQTGMVSGKRRASTKRAFKDSLLIFGAGLIIFLIGMLMAFALPGMYRFLSAISSYVILLGFVCILGSAAPYIMAWDYNRKQELAEAKLQ